METDKKMAFSGALTLKDFLKYQFYHFRRFYIIYNLFIVVAIAAVLILLELSSWTFAVLYAFFLAIIGIILQLVIMRWRFKKEFQSDRFIQARAEFRVTEAGIEQKTSSSTVFFKWNDIRRAHRNKEFYRLYVAKSKALIIPFRYFASDNEQNEFEEWLKANIPVASNKLSASPRFSNVLLFCTGGFVLIAAAIFLFIGTGEQQDGSPETGRESGTVNESGDASSEAKDEEMESFNEPREEVGFFIFASRESPGKVNMIELREVVLKQKGAGSFSADEEQQIVRVRAYYGKNGGILEDYVEFDPGGSFFGDKFEVKWKNDWEATVTMFADTESEEKLVESSYEILIEKEK